jgi:hypothetical protein
MVGASAEEKQATSACEAHIAVETISENVLFSIATAAANRFVVVNGRIVSLCDGKDFDRLVRNAIRITGQLIERLCPCKEGSTYDVACWFQETFLRLDRLGGFRD